MKHKNKFLQHIKKIQFQLRLLTAAIILIILFVLVSVVGESYWANIVFTSTDNNFSNEEPKKVRVVSDFIMTPYPDNEDGRLAAYGESLITETAKYLGPNNQHGEIYSGNNLACASCHLNGGTKPYAAPYIGLDRVYPRFSARDGKMATLEDRVNGCFERSMNGRKLPIRSKEMAAIVSYMNHLSTHVESEGRIEGQGFVSLELPDRAADLTHGELVFNKHCVSCHQQNGQGLWRDSEDKTKGYLYPPLWDADSYNDGAGMGRMLTAAKFIKGNMPLGATAEQPMLTDEEAYDVAAYINSFSRPEKENKELDYPDLAQKPKDSAYPPFADHISAEQHKYGPFNF